MRNNIHDFKRENRGIMLFLAYVLLGFTVAMPIGAISIEMIKQGLKNGFMNSWMVGLGSIFIDIFLLLMLNLGFAEVLNRIQTYLWLFGAMFLFYLGWESFKNKSSEVILQGGNTKIRKRDSFKRGLFIGVNPGNIVFWVSVLGTSIANVSVETEVAMLWVSVAILIGIMLHDVGLAFVSSFFNKYMNEKANRWVSIIAGAMLIGFGCYFLFNFYENISNN